MTFYVYLWAALLLFFILAEAGTHALVSIWFMPGALVAMILAIFRIPFWIQCPVFVVLSVVLFVSTRKIALRLIGGKVQPTNADRVLGQIATVTETVPAGGIGQVKVLGQVWSATAGDLTTVFEVGTSVRVDAIDGVKLKVSLYTA